jgi:hypothetical protein
VDGWNSICQRFLYTRRQKQKELPFLTTALCGKLPYRIQARENKAMQKTAVKQKLRKVPLETTSTLPQIAELQ